MMKGAGVKPTHKPVKTGCAALTAYADQSIEHEGAVRSAFFLSLLADTYRVAAGLRPGRQRGWTLIPELSPGANGHSIRPASTLTGYARPPREAPPTHPGGPIPLTRSDG